MAHAVRQRTVQAVGRTRVNGLALHGCIGRRRTRAPPAIPRDNALAVPSQDATRTRSVPVNRSKDDPGAGPDTSGADAAGRRVASMNRDESRMVNVHSIDELAQRLAALVPPGMQQARDDLTANFRSLLQSGLRELDLVTREEFDVQRCVLLRTREKIEELEQQVANLERAIGTSAPKPAH